MSSTLDPMEKQARTVSFIDEDEYQMHKLYRERIVQEDTLVNHRMTWMILSQAFMVALWATIAQRVFVSGGLPFLRVPMGIIGLTGCLFAVGSFFAIRAAHLEIAQLRDEYTGIYQPSDLPKHQRKPGVPIGNDKLPGLTGSKNFHFLGQVVPTCLPWAIVSLWVVLLFASLLIWPV